MFGFNRYSNNTSEVVRNIVTLNIGFFMLTWLGPRFIGLDFYHLFGLHHFTSGYFKPWQLLTHMFMHGNLFHLFFNMFAVWMIGSYLERLWGGKRFLIFYFFSGAGAILLHTLVQDYQIGQVVKFLSGEQIEMIRSTTNYSFNEIVALNPSSSASIIKYNNLVNTPTVGASGAVFGILGAFALLFPNTELMLMFLPIPIKAKWFAIGYGVLELFLGAKGVANGASDGVAHFAHVGGLIFGILLVLFWNKTNKKEFF
ncbi:MAG: rhomboid family intramembrane serine protease [Bacteroidota bacterium]|nr:rhomboid family intramembrane serine protease [Bacteroidota bacterium]